MPIAPPTAPTWQITTPVLGRQTLGNVGHGTSSLGHGLKLIASAGTDERLADYTEVKWVMLQALPSNTGAIAIGGPGVDAASTGVTLEASDSLTLPLDNLTDIYLDATVNGDGVRYTYGA